MDLQLSFIFLDNKKETFETQSLSGLILIFWKNTDPDSVLQEVNVSEQFLREMKR